MALGIQLVKSESQTIVVPDDYATIQKAINAAYSGDTIFVRAGTYAENIVVNKTVSLIGGNRATTIIDACGSGTVVYVTANNVNISGFTIRNGGIPTVWPGESGIILYYSDYTTITNCIITSNAGYGLCFVTSRYYTISNSLVSHNNNIGIAVGDTGSSNGVIRNNTVYSNRLSGIEAYWGSDDTIVEDNTVYNNMMGIVFGWSSNCLITKNRLYNNTASVLLDTTSQCTVLNNNISNKQGIVLLGLGGYFNSILNNTISLGECGISLGASARYTTISGNVLSRNEYGLVIAYNQGYRNWGNKIFHNDFIDNKHQAVDNATGISDPNIWDNGYPSGGNYWNDYVGKDVDQDGIGDIAYSIVGTGGSKDRYPLMNPWVAGVIARVDVKPDTLNLRTRGQWTTCYIELPEGYNVSDIDASTIRLNNSISASPKPIAIGDYDGDKAPDLMVKFDRTEVINYILSIAGKQAKFSQVTLTVTGILGSGTHFEGSDTIKIY